MRGEPRIWRRGARRAAAIAPIVVLLLIGVLVPPTRLGGVARAEASNDRPDIVLVLLDDLTEADWRSLPQTSALLPSTFPNYVNTDPWCCPSRASILLGQYPHNHGTLLVKNGPTGGWESFRDREDATIAVVLQQAGYRTALIGKYLNGYPDDGGVPPGWDRWFAKIGHKYLDWRAVDGAAVRAFGRTPADYATDVIARETVAFVRATPPDQPLFALVAPPAPHIPATPAVRHAGRCDDLPLGSAGKPSLNEADVADKPVHVRADAPLPLDALTAFDRDRQCSLLAVDELVVAVVAALETRGRPFDLLVATDNGYLLGEHRRTRKNVPYEESIRTTMRVVGPGFPPGEDRRLVANIDLAPTFAALAGAAPRPDWDGRSLLPAAGLERSLIGLEGFGGGEDDEAGSGRADRLGAAQTYPSYRGFRTHDGLVYVEYETGETELYDLTSDPYQLDNLAAGNPPADVPRLHARLEDLRRCAAASCWAAEDAPLAVAGGDARGDPSIPIVGEIDRGRCAVHLAGRSRHNVSRRQG